jgi:hypothetical protein
MTHIPNFKLLFLHVQDLYIYQIVGFIYLFILLINYFLYKINRIKKISFFLFNLGIFIHQ